MVTGTGSGSCTLTAAADVVDGRFAATPGSTGWAVPGRRLGIAGLLSGALMVDVSARPVLDVPGRMGVLGDMVESFH
ncbi:hypothetical protein AWM79_10690 [Pseudomonas agarici]|uniref:Uncharacterized protein n=1 Tax=Pseudomonas agarici TaxID=46677 RepID=A0A0X1T122_PSEAA|nr:hypothetical protein AWM79_10690 [Pseudomonas agarici]